MQNVVTLKNNSKREYQLKQFQNYVTLPYWHGKERKRLNGGFPPWHFTGSVQHIEFLCTMKTYNNQKKRDAPSHRTETHVCQSGVSALGFGSGLAADADF